MSDQPAESEAESEPEATDAAKALSLQRQYAWAVAGIIVAVVLILVVPLAALVSYDRGTPPLGRSGAITVSVVIAAFELFAAGLLASSALVHERSSRQLEELMS